MSIVILNESEELQQFLDSELTDITETISQYGLRSIELTYTFNEYVQAKTLLKQGNKIWISNENTLRDCLYVINTEVEQDIYDENNFSVEAEEVLTELNYASLFSQTELITDNGFTIVTLNGQSNVTVDWNALNYWFGEYFNIGIVQDCLNNLVQSIPIKGTMNRMELLRYIEEKTGNIFISRYEKDCLSNTIHRYLDFLNPQTDLKPWQLNLEYNFEDLSESAWYQYDCTDEEDDEADDEDDSIPDGTPHYNQDDEIDMEGYDWHNTIQELPGNVDPAHLKFQIRDPNLKIINVDDDEDQPIEWLASDLGLDGTEDVVIQLSWNGSAFGVSVNTKSYAVIGTSDVNADCTGTIPSAYVDDWETVTHDYETFIPDDSYFVMYDTSKDLIVYQTVLNYRLGSAHNEVLHFGSNVNNIEYDIDESDTYKAMAPVIEDSNNTYTTTELNKLINSYLGLEVEKGELIPLTLEKFNQEGSNLNNAKDNLPPAVKNSYWSRPAKPNDTAGSSYEFYKVTSYARSPFSKASDSLNVVVEENTGAEYTTVHGRQDTRIPQGAIAHEKIGNVNSTDDEKYLIFQKVVSELQEKRKPKIKISVDVANLKDHRYNDYDIWDKVFVKIPGVEEVVTARVSKVTHELHDPAKDKIELDNYSIFATAMQQMTYIEANNMSFDYSMKKTFTATLINEDYNSSDPTSIEYPANQMLTLMLYKYEKNSSKAYATYTKMTDENGQVHLTLKLDPADYDLKISYAGDEEYMDCELTVKINVTGTKNEEKDKTKKKTKTKSKTASKKVNRKGKTEKKRYYSKYGVSPDKKFILAVGKRSVVNDPGDEDLFYETQFRNKCPNCGRTQTLLYGYNWTGNKKKDIGKFDGTNTKEPYSTRGMVFCTSCHHKYSVFGNELAKSNPQKLTITTKTKTLKKNGETRANQLIQGKIYYDSIWVKNKKKKVAKFDPSAWTYSARPYNCPKKYRTYAHKIVGNAYGLQAAQLIANWCTRNIHYKNYIGFHHNANWVYKHRKGNCCDQTRLMLTLMNAAGCMKYLKLKWVHVTAGNRGHIFARIYTRKGNGRLGRGRYVDPCRQKKGSSGYYGWGVHVTGYGRPPGRQNKYTGWGSKPTGM